LNCTSRKQVEEVLPRFFNKRSTPEFLSFATFDVVAETILSLGFKNKRAKGIIKTSKSYLKRNWKSPREFPGIGEYGTRAWEIFIENKLGDEPPNGRSSGVILELEKET